METSLPSVNVSPSANLLSPLVIVSPSATIRSPSPTANRNNESHILHCVPCLAVRAHNAQHATAKPASVKQDKRNDCAYFPLSMMEFDTNHMEVDEVENQGSSDEVSSVQEFVNEENTVANDNHGEFSDFSSDDEDNSEDEDDDDSEDDDDDDDEDPIQILAKLESKQHDLANVMDELDCLFTYKRSNNCLFLHLQERD
jgi:hypothetical protein